MRTGLNRERIDTRAIQVAVKPEGAGSRVPALVE